MTIELGEGDESCQCRGYRTGELRRWGNDRAANVTADSGACGEPPARPSVDRAAGMGNRTGRHPLRPRSARTRYGASLLSRRGEESGAQFLDRITQREGVLSLLGRPFGERRSILCGRSRAWDGPSRFLWLETLAKPETEPSIADDGCRWQRKWVALPESLPALRQRWASD